MHNIHILTSSTASNAVNTLKQYLKLTKPKFILVTILLYENSSRKTTDTPFFPSELLEIAKNRYIPVYSVCCCCFRY